MKLVFLFHFLGSFRVVVITMDKKKKNDKLGSASKFINYLIQGGE